MKPKSELQRRVYELSSKLPEITEKQKQWAFDHCFELRGYYHKSKCWCLACGVEYDSFETELMSSVIGKDTCPCCGATLNIQNRTRKNYSEAWYYTILTTFSGFQVCRHCIVEKAAVKGFGRPHYSFHEVVQHWIDERGKEVIIARPCKCVPHCYDAWDYFKPMRLMKRRTMLSYYPDKYYIDSKYLYPRKRILPILRRNGYSSRFKGIASAELFALLLSDSRAEEFIKTNQYAVLKYHYCHKFPDKWMHALRIANRNGYIIKDASMWIDYLELLEYFNMDTHNAKYVCAKGMKSEHDKLMRRKEKIEKRRRKEKELQEVARMEEEYSKAKGRYFGICFGGDGISVSVISSVADIYEEGKAMHHCVYWNEYFKKEESLILSARDREGNRLETIEINLKTFKIVQSRSAFNQISPMHDDILSLVNKNMNLIRGVS